MSPILSILCVLCTTSPGSPPQPQFAVTAGKVWHRHERAGSQHLLRLSTGGRIIDSDAKRRERMLAFADAYAARYCRSPFRLREARRRSWPDVRPIHDINVVFSCLPGRPARTVVTARG